MFQFIPFPIVCVLLQMSSTHLASASSQVNISKVGDYWTTLGVVPVVIDAAPPETLIVCYANLFISDILESFFLMPRSNMKVV